MLIHSDELMSTYSHSETRLSLTLIGCGKHQGRKFSNVNRGLIFSNYNCAKVRIKCNQKVKDITSKGKKYIVPGLSAQ